jgi:acetyl esterase/lipase
MNLRFLLTSAASVVSLWVVAAAALADGRVNPVYINPSANQTVEWLPAKQADYRLLYGNNSLWYGDLRLPKGKSPRNGWPVVVFVHGGGWSSSWSNGYTARLVEAINNLGVATWDLEFRRMGNTGGGWPGTFQDVALGTDYLRTLATKFPLDLSRVIVAGHSSGGHLVAWLAGRHRLATDSPLYKPDPLKPAGVLSLAGIPDLDGALVRGNRTDVLQLLGVATREEAMARYDDASPIETLPHGMPEIHIVGTRDNPWRIAITQDYAALARSMGEQVEVVLLDGANHFDVVDPCGPAWSAIARAVLSLLEERVDKRDIRIPGSRACPSERYKESD